MDQGPWRWQSEQQATIPAAAAASEPRFIGADGIRYYLIPAQQSESFVAVPGVTSLLSAGERQEDRDTIEKWRLRELAAGRDPNAGRERGTRVHAMLENVVRCGSFGPGSAEDLGYASGMEQHLELFDSFSWNERPLVSHWDHCWSGPKSDPNRMARVWSAEWGFAGTPDLIGRFPSGLQVLGDSKTATRPYYRPMPCRSVPRFAELGYKKYKKTVRQLCAYRLAIKETLDLDIDQLMIIVGLPKPGASQLFLVGQHEMKRETETIKRLAEQFWSKRSQPLAA